MEGIINVLKPPGMTSSNVVADIRRLSGIRRVGHTGTLDPGAAGVLPVCLGRATRLFDFLVDKQKAYIAEIAFGVRTDTQDSYGAVVERDTCVIEPAMLEAALPAFRGSQSQVAPAYSALKAGGTPLYALARGGQTVPERVRQMHIYTLEYLRQTAGNRFLLRVECSRGTYVRMLCEDIGRALGACAHMSFLLRTATGPFLLEDAYSIAELAALREADRLPEAVLSVEQVLAFLPMLRLEEVGEAARLRNGVELAMQAGWPEETCRVYGPEGFLGVGGPGESGMKLKLHF